MTVAEDEARVRQHLTESAAVKLRTADACAGQVAAASQLVAASMKVGGKLMICGNGGSAADSQHLAAEFTNRLTSHTERPPLPALALTTDTSFLTAFANDYGFENVFARQVRALGRRGDVLMVISTSGNSKNIVRAVDEARELGIRTVGLLGSGGGAVSPLVDVSIVVPETRTAYVQETHIALCHVLCGLVETAMASSG